MVRLELAIPGLQTQCSSQSFCWEGVEFIQLVYCIIIYLSFLKCQTSHLRGTVVLLDTGTPGTSRETYSEDEGRETQTHNQWITNQAL